MPSHHKYFSRVRSGCLTCRSRKVKCDEARPACGNCTRLKRPCVYGQKALDGPPIASQPRQPREVYHSSPNTPLVSPHATNQHADTPDSVDTFVPAWSSPSASQSSQVQGHSRDASMAFISRDIELTVTMDVLALRTESPHMTTLFLESIDCPSITPFDACNWQVAKRCMVHLGQKSCPAISACITAVAALFKGHVYALPLTGAVSHYRAALRHVDDLVNDHGTPFGFALVATFLLCLFEFLHAGDLVPHLLQQANPLFVRRLETWAQDPTSSSNTSLSTLSVRIVAWLKIMQASTTRGGGTGLLSKRIYRLLPDQNGSLPDIESLPGILAGETDSVASNHVYQLLSAPIFHFYCRLQALSRDIAKLTLYHRSRTTSHDQQEVVDRMAALKGELLELWEGRSTTQRQPSEELRAQLAPALADRLLSLIAICNAAYYAEIVEMGRQLGDPLSRLPDSREALDNIREAVERQSKDSKVNAGFLRALFLYAIESTEPNQIQWAVDKLAQIEPRIYRGAFFSAFAQALSEAQVEKERRVTSRYFCIWYFGVSPPYM
ncbi:hypothetical protein SEUCBS140593_005576 [Sporothrix eucalyptigena]|uniref:Zn(2)-C6 fungal-type domain-containing protein n=1 Tax=Sporothrix eucalyptigena TaxID=1812306 RepID=A0ABP0BXP5_9PEZI